MGPEDWSPQPLRGPPSASLSGGPRGTNGNLDHRAKLASARANRRQKRRKRIGRVAVQEIVELQMPADREQVGHEPQFRTPGQ
jgi:hypothetical protein